MTKERGGSITIAEKSTLMMNNTRILNSYGYYGGVIYIEDFAVLYFNDCEILGAQTLGTIIDIDNSFLSITNNKISTTFNNLFLIVSSEILINGMIISNHTCNTRIQGCILTAQVGSNIRILNATIMNINSRTSNNIYLESSIAIINKLYINNTMNEQKEGCCIGSKESELDIRGSEFQNYLGNCLNIQTSNLRINNSFFHANQFETNSFNLGAFYCLDCESYIIEASNFSFNQHVVKGAAIQCINNYKKDENASLSKIINNVFQENQASELGGAIYLKNQQVKVENCDFIKNSANEGGGIYCSMDGKIY